MRSRASKASVHSKGKNGLMLVSDNNDALAARILVTRAATTTLDLMYYIWRSDETGKLLASEVVRAAQRGVKVRVLIDDINPQSSDDAYIALDRHPNIQLRLFNPSRIRNGNIFRRLEFIYRLLSMTRRMHTKAWIADRQIAISGGRNIGDEYFNAADTNFRDMDLLLLGDVTAQICDVFETFWNCPSSKPVRLLQSTSVDAESEATATPAADTDFHVAASRYAKIDDLLATGNLHWIERARVVADPPEKAQGRLSEEWLMTKLLPLLESSKAKLEIISPYFIPGRRGTGVMERLISRGVGVSVLTNSLAATDVAAVHGAYARYRVSLLKKGVQLFEFRPSSGVNRISVLGSKGSSLHTKSFTVDDRAGFVGSFNFDPRSRSLNAEMGIVFEDEPLVKELRDHFARETEPDISYRVFLKERKLFWSGGSTKEPSIFRREPEAGLFRRLTALAVRFLPIESQL